MMNRIRTFVAGIPVCIGLVIPSIALLANAAPIQDREDHNRDDKEHHRYYDREHRDYHEWNADEQRHWRDYWASERMPYVDWDRASDDQRQGYWNWRHAHDEHHRDQHH